MRKIIAIIITLVLLSMAAGLVAMGTEDEEVAGITRGIILVQPEREPDDGENGENGNGGEDGEDGAIIWTLIFASGRAPRTFELIDGVLMYTPLDGQGEPLSAVPAYLEPAVRIDEDDFTDGDIFIRYIGEDGDEESILVRLNADGQLLAGIIREDDSRVFQVLIDRQYLMIDEEATGAAEDLLEPEDEEPGDEDPDVEPADARHVGSMEALYDAIPWETLERSRVRRETVSISVELRRDEDSEDWVVSRAVEIPPPGALVSNSAWVLAGAVFVALIINIVLSVVRSRK